MQTGVGNGKINTWKTNCHRFKSITPAIEDSKLSLETTKCESVKLLLATSGLGREDAIKSNNDQEVLERLWKRILRIKKSWTVFKTLKVVPLMWSEPVIVSLGVKNVNYRLLTTNERRFNQLAIIVTSLWETDGVLICWSLETFHATEVLGCFQTISKLHCSIEG